MTHEEFREMFDLAREKRTGNFVDAEGESSLVKATAVEIEKSEGLLGVRLPDRLRWFLQNIGGGEFGSELVFTAIPSGRGSLAVENVRFADANFTALVDDQTGGCYGVVSENGVCGDQIFYWDDIEGPPPIRTEFTSILNFLAARVLNRILS